MQTFVPNRPLYDLLMYWLALLGMIVFGCYVAWDNGLIQLLLSSDQSRISYVIALLFFVATAHCLRRIWFVTNELNAAVRTEQQLEAGGGHADLQLEEGFVAEYVRDHLATHQASLVEQGEAGTGNLAAVYASRLKRPHELGWFIADVMVRLGLMGTIVGFVLMLGSIADTASLDANTMQRVLKEMSVGMGTALYTTLAGLVGSLLIAMQFHLLDRAADALLEKSVYIAEVLRLPKP